ncbi:MAG: hypothetical protein HAW58_06515 [Candidatus Thioglobus sp.]|nr:hypothetical protein [Candidatus Thioglobus sp.]
MLNKLKLAKTPTTYLLKSSPNVSRLLRGNFDTIALRLTDNNLISQLCKATGSALVATSANISGKPVAASLLDLRIIFKGQLDFCIAPKIGDNRPSKIINLHTGERLR